MNNRFETSIKYLIRDMRMEFSNINTWLATNDNNVLIFIKSYLNVIVNQIDLLSEDFYDPIRFIKNIGIIKSYSQAIYDYISSNYNDTYYSISINSLNGIVYCDEIANVYLNSLSTSTLENFNSLENNNNISARI